MWLCSKWKEAYDCCMYVVIVIAHQAVLHHCTQVISLNQMIWSSVLMTSKSNQLSWFKPSSKFLFIHFFLPLNISNFSKNCNHSEKGHPSKNWNPTKLSLFENLVGSSTLSKKNECLHYEIMINFKTIAK